MTQYREILRLNSIGISGRRIAETLHCSRNTVARALESAKKHNISWPLTKEQTDIVLEKLLYSRENVNLSNKRMPDFEYVSKEYKRCGVSKILVPDNCKTAVLHNTGFSNQELNPTYNEMAEHYGTAII